MSIPLGFIDSGEGGQGHLAGEDPFAELPDAPVSRFNRKLFCYSRGADPELEEPSVARSGKGKKVSKDKGKKHRGRSRGH